MSCLVIPLYHIRAGVSSFHRTHVTIRKYEEKYYVKIIILRKGLFHEKFDKLEINFYFDCYMHYYHSACDALFFGTYFKGD
jgi:hypothetical protein